jgi:hypothetical protein
MNCDGGIMDQLLLSGPCSIVRFSGPEDNSVAISVENKKILIYRPAASSDLIELSFSGLYGEISKIEWFKDGYLCILVAFRPGYVIACSTDVLEHGRELQVTFAIALRIYWVQ